MVSHEDQILIKELRKSRWGAKTLLSQFLETLVYKNVKRYENVEDLKNAIRESWDAWSVPFIQRSIDQWRYRLQKVVEV